MEETRIKRISAEEFAALDFSKVTLLDLREKDEVLVKGIDGAINVPFSQIATGLSQLPQDKPVYVFCREVMKSKNVSSLEELIQSAIDHGVRLVACQMSMEIMGIRQEELIDGVELGGVATFLGSGEQSNMSLFI